jgi:predicted transcriptional regulator
MYDDKVFDLAVAFNTHLVDLDGLEDFHTGLVEWAGAHANLTPSLYADLRKDYSDVHGVMSKLDGCFVPRDAVTKVTDLAEAYADRVLAVLPTLNPERVIKHEEVLLVVFDTGIGIFTPTGYPLGTLYAEEDTLYADELDSRLDSVADAIDDLLRNGTVEKAIMAFAKDPITDGPLS